MVGQVYNDMYPTLGVPHRVLLLSYKPSVIHLGTSAPSDLWHPPICGLPFPECHRVGTRQHVSFPHWFLSLPNMHLSLLQVFSWLLSSFLLPLNNILLSGWMRFFIHPLLKGIMAASSQVLAVVNEAAMHIHA